MSETLDTLATRQLLLGAAIGGLTGNARSALLPSQSIYERASTIAAWALRHRNNLAYEALGKESSSEQRQRLGVPTKLDYAAAAYLGGMLANARNKEEDPVEYGKAIYAAATELLEETRTLGGDGADRTMRYLQRVALGELQPGPLSEEEVVRFASACGGTAIAAADQDPKQVTERALLLGRQAGSS